MHHCFKQALAAVTAAAITLLPAAPSFADGASHLTGVASANTKVTGMSAPNILSPELRNALVVQGSWKVENPSDLTSFYGYDNDGPLVPAPGDLPCPPAVCPPAAPHKVEASKSEPDKNTYLVLRNQHGFDPNYNYGQHFLFQGHETGTAGYLTRVNLDADGKHRVTLLATKDVNSNPIPLIDGSTWYPFSERLLFTAELGGSGGVWQATADYPSAVEDISGVFGRGGYEGIQADRQGRLIIVEDVGGSRGTGNNAFARRPNSFVYRFVPYFPADLKLGGKLQVLQVASRAHGGPIVFGANADADITSQDQIDLHTYGLVFDTTWVTIHDTKTDGFVPFDANALAKANRGTPFKRPENGQFQPGSNFTEFFFDATGDTDNRTSAAAFGGFGAIFRLRLQSDNSGRLSLFYLSDQAHTGLDNCAFWDANHIVFVEDAGDTLHTQRNALDSAYLFDVNADYGNPANQPVRVLAEGRDASATLDSQFLGMTGFNNDGDNEITGWHVSDGDAGVTGLLGAKNPHPFQDGWRVFWTQQHGDNTTWEILPAGKAENDDD